MAAKWRDFTYSKDFSRSGSENAHFDTDSVQKLNILGANYVHTRNCRQPIRLQCSWSWTILPEKCTGYINYSAACWLSLWISDYAWKRVECYFVAVHIMQTQDTKLHSLLSRLSSFISFTPACIINLSAWVISFKMSPRSTTPIKKKKKMDAV